VHVFWNLAHLKIRFAPHKSEKPDFGRDKNYCNHLSCNKLISTDFTVFGTGHTKIAKLTWCSKPRYCSKKFRPIAQNIVCSFSMQRTQIIRLLRDAKSCNVISISNYIFLAFASPEQLNPFSEYIQLNKSMCRFPLCLFIFLSCGKGSWCVHCPLTYEK